VIIGKGLLGKAFEKYRSSEDILIFASGVSNSLEQKSGAFLREEVLLKEFLGNRDALFVYFGTCSVYDPSRNTSAYVQHKLRMEEIIKGSGNSFAIFRLPQIVGHCSNQSTVLNYFYHNIATGKPFDLWGNAIRYLVDIDDVVRFVSFVLDGKRPSCLTHNLVTKPCKVSDLVASLEKLIGIKAICRLVNKGVFYSIPSLKGQVSITDAGVIVDEWYVEKTLQKFVETVC